MELLFKKIAVEQLSSLLSEYVVELNKKKLNLADDTVTLKSLTLKERDLPGVGLRVKGGYVGMLKFSVPWKRLKKESVVVNVDQVFVVLGARAVTDADRDYAWNQSQASKRAKLDIAEAVEEKGYIERYLDTIKQNLKIEISDIKIVMELDDWDPSSKAGPRHSGIPSFRIRLTVEHVSLETTDGQWVPQFLDETQVKGDTQSNRQITIKKIGVRMCDKMPEKSLDIFQHVAVEGADREEQKVYGRRVLDELPQVRMRVKLRQTSEEMDKRDVTVPEVDGHLETSECNLVFNKFQYATLVGAKLQELWKPDELRRLVHPTVGGELSSLPLARPQRGHSAAQWWRFAISVVMHSAAVTYRQNSGRVSWKYFCDLVTVGRPYMKAWKKKLRKFEWTEAEKLLARQTEGFKAEGMLRGTKHWVPGRLCVADILYFRELAEAEKDAEDERDGSKRTDMALSALKGFSPRPRLTSDVGIKDAKQAAETTKKTLTGLRAKAAAAFEQAQAKAQDMADIASELAMIGVEEDVPEGGFPEFVWLSKEDVGDMEAKVPFADVKAGLRYFADGDVRVVKTEEGVKVVRFQPQLLDSC